MKTLISDILPCWYELSWIPKEIGILIRIHQSAVEKLNRIPNDAPIFEYFKKEFDFKEFEANLAKNFGFEKAMVHLQEKDGFVELLAKAPHVMEWTKEKCQRCKGKKRDPGIGGKCMSCNGSGKERIYKWQSAYAVSASFTVLFQMLNMIEGDIALDKMDVKEIPTNFPQLLTVETVTKHDMHGGSLGGSYGVPLVSWLAAKSKGLSRQHHIVLEEMEKAMKIAYSHMFGKSSLDEYQRFEAHIDYEGGWLNVSCPGDACGLNPSNSWMPDRDKGYQFSCHNVDNPVQQFTLLAGLAALHDQVRRELST